MKRVVLVGLLLIAFVVPQTVWAFSVSSKTAEQVEQLNNVVAKLERQNAELYGEVNVLHKRIDELTRTVNELIKKLDMAR